MLAKVNQQATFTIKHLHAALDFVDYPDVVITIERNTLGPREMPRPIAGFAEFADEIAFGIKDLYPVVQCVSNI